MKKIIKFLIFVFVISILGFILYNYMLNKKGSLTYIVIPSEYKGNVLVIFDVDSATSLIEEKGNLFVKPQTSGIVITSSNVNDFSNNPTFIDEDFNYINTFSSDSTMNILNFGIDTQNNVIFYHAYINKTISKKPGEILKTENKAIEFRDSILNEFKKRYTNNKDIIK